jgi:S1-C subfamily serine protease
MKLLRPVLFAIILAGAFFYFTTYRNQGYRSTNWLSRPQRVEVIEAAGGGSLDAEEQNNISVYRKNIGSVVNITSRVMTFDFFYGAVPQEGQGSGFVIDREGHILTNYHVIEQAREVWVTLHNRKKYRASIVGTDKSHDLAIVQIKGADLEPMTLGDSRNLQVGQKVYAIGNPFGLAGTLTLGIVSSIRQVQEPDGMVIEEAIQTDAAINPGNSGGPLLNSHGEVIGINTMIASASGGSSGVGFAIPINAAKAVLNDLVQFGRVRRPTLGIRPLPVPMNRELAEQLNLPSDTGVLVMQVVPGSAAARAGIQGGNKRVYYGNYEIIIGGDLIVEIDGQPVKDTQDLAHLMNNHRSGDYVTIVYYHGQKRESARVQLDEAKNGTRT